MKRARSIRLQPKLLLGLVAMAAVLAAILAPSIAQLYRWLVYTSPSPRA